LRGFRTATAAAHFSFKLSDPPGREREQGDDRALIPLLTGVLAKDSGRTEAEVMGWLTQGIEFTPEQALQRGLIDGIAARPRLPTV
jgi:hypothetical protein